MKAKTLSVVVAGLLAASGYANESSDGAYASKSFPHLRHLEMQYRDSGVVWQSLSLPGPKIAKPRGIVELIKDEWQGDNGAKTAEFGYVVQTAKHLQVTVLGYVECDCKTVELMRTKADIVGKKSFRDLDISGRLVMDGRTRSIDIVGYDPVHRSFEKANIDGKPMQDSTREVVFNYLRHHVVNNTLLERFTYSSE